MKSRLGAALGLLALSVAPAMAADAASGYPNKPIRWVLPFPPGGSTDVVVRIVGPRLSEVFGQQVVIDNRPGAGTNIGMDIVAKAAPDGYTMLLSTASLAINTSLYRKLPFDPVRDLAPVTLLTNTPNMMAVHPGVPAKTVREFIDLAKAKPGGLSYGSSGNGASNHLAMELLKVMTGIDVIHVPYKGGGPAQVDLIAGQIQALFNPPSTLMPHARNGRVRAVAVGSRKRIAIAPEMPTFDESGVPGYEAGVWFGLLVPSGTPKAIIDRLNREVTRILAAPDVAERLTSLGYEPLPGTPQAFAAFIQSEIGKWSKVVKASGARVD
jgi:tripartite-type tricarboxylate transporter receptor subunit TctC